MAHIGIERFAACHRQDHRAQRHKGGPGLVGEQREGVSRIGGEKNLRLLGDFQSAQDRQDDEPQHHHRAKHLAEPFDAAILQQEQHHQDHQGDGDDPGLERLGRPQAFHGGQDRDGGRQHAVAIEQRQPHQCRHADRRLGPARYRCAVRQGRQCHHPAFAIVVRAHDEADIFDGHHDHQRPKDQRQRAIDRRRAGGVAANRQRGLAHGVQRAGADVAKHHAQSAECQPQGAAERNVGVLLQGQVVIWVPSSATRLGGR